MPRALSYCIRRCLIIQQYKREHVTNQNAPYSSHTTFNPVTSLRVSPTDISQFLRLEQCQRYLRLKLQERVDGRDFMTEYGINAQSIPPLLTKSGALFEEKVEAAVNSRWRAINFTHGNEAGNRPSNNLQVVEAARGLAAGEAVFLFQSRLDVSINEWAVRGDVDLMRIERSGDGALRVLIVDMKSSTAAKVEHRLQVAFYYVMLETLFAEHAIECGSIQIGILYRGVADLADGNQGMTAEQLGMLSEQQAQASMLFGVDDGYLEIVGDPRPYLESVADLVTSEKSVARRLASADFGDIPYHLTYKCGGCLYNEFCMKWSAEHDDLSLLPHVVALEKEALKRTGITSMHELAHLKDLVRSARPTGTDDQSSDMQLTPAPGKEGLVRRIAVTWPVGPRMDELVHRARRYRKFKGEKIEMLTYIPSKGYGSLPFCSPDHNPNLVRVYIDSQHDYLQDRVYMLGALVVASENGVEKPERRRSIVRITDGPPDTLQKEGELFVSWINSTIEAIAQVVAPDANGKASAPIHIIFFDKFDQTVLLDGLGRHMTSILGATPMYDFVTQQAAFDSPISTFLSDEIRELKNYPMVCQSLQAVAAFLKFDWRRKRNYREIFKERMFDFWNKLEDERVADGESPWYTNRARFTSQIPLEYAYAAWGELPAPAPGKEDELRFYRGVDPELLQEFHAVRLEAMECVAKDFRGNHLTLKTAFDIPNLLQFTQKAQTLANALEEFVTVERHVDLAEWKSTRNLPPERRALLGETLIVQYLAEDQEPESAAVNSDHQHRHNMREAYEKRYIEAHPGETKAKLSKEEKKETEWSQAGISYRLRISTDGTDADLDQLLTLSMLKQGERVVFMPRTTVDSRLPANMQTENTPTPKQMLYGTRAEIKQISVERDEAGKASSASVELEMQGTFGGNVPGFLFASFNAQPLVEGKLYTLDSDPNDIYGYWCYVVASKLSELESKGTSEVGSALYDRLVDMEHASIEWGEQETQAQNRFLEGLQAFHEIGALHAFEQSKMSYIGEHGSDPIVLVQGPPGTGKSYSTAFAIFSRIQGALAAGRTFRVMLTCKTHAATDVLLENVRDVQRKLRNLSEHEPELFAQYFDLRILDVPLLRLAPRTDIEGVRSLAKDAQKEKGEPQNIDILLSLPVCVVAATPGGIYGIVKDKWTTKSLFGHYFVTCLVLDEASQMNLPEAVMSALPLDPHGQLIVVGDHRQMPPIVKHDWAGERRRTFQEFKSYQSLFDTLLSMNPPPPMIKFAESFRLHADMAEFLRREVYAQDNIEFHSKRVQTLKPVALEDEFAAAVLTPEYPIVIVVHDEMQSQTRNLFEQQLVGPVLDALADEQLYSFNALEGLGVVVPHRAQRADMQALYPQLSAKDAITGLTLKSAVDTVERFQGGERTAILVTATESDRDYLLAASGFLYDPRRLTVAISRAKEKMILVASRSVFELFSTDEDAFANAQLWKNLLRRTCTVKLWEGERDGTHVEVWGNQKSSE